MESKARKTLTGIVVFLMAVSLASATGYLKSQNGSVVLQPVDNQVLPSSDNSVDFGGPANRWNEVYANFFYSKASGGSDGGFRLKNSSGNNIFHWVYYEPTRTMYLAQSGVSELMTYKEGESSLKFYKSLTPGSDFAYDLGSPGSRWANVYAQNVRGLSNVYMQGGNLLILGDATDQYVNLLSQPGYTPRFRFIPEGNWSRGVMLFQNLLRNGQTGLVFQASLGERIFLPVEDKAYSLGTSSYAWGDVNLYNLRLKPSAAAPPCDNGVMYLNTANQLKVCLGGVWKTVQVA